MSLFSNVIIPEFMPYLLGLLGLLLIWQFHQLQVMAGRIQAVDFWDRSGIRMFVHVVAHDGNTCPSCEAADRMAFLPSLATKKDFTPYQKPCTNDSACRGISVGLYGGWSEANHLVDQLRKEAKKKPMKLSEDALKNLIGGRWERSISGNADRVAIHILEAMGSEREDPEGALFRYRFVVDQATGGRDLHFVVPSYFGLCSLLERLGRYKEALEVIDHFEKRFGSKKSAPHFPNETQRGLMSIGKSRLVMKLRQAGGSMSEHEPMKPSGVSTGIA